MSVWPHDSIYSAALPYIRSHVTKEAEWRCTRLDALAGQLARIVRLDDGERVIVSCFLDGQRWSVMTTSRVFGVVRGSPFTCSPTDVAQWRCVDGIATLAMTDGTHMRLPFERGSAASALIHYGRFWTDELRSIPVPLPSSPP